MRLRRHARSHRPSALPSHVLLRARASAITGLLAGLVLAGGLTGPLTQAARGEAQWTTYHRDAARSGDDPDASVSSSPTFAWQTEDLGAPIWGQPLVLGSHVYVATVGDKLFELSASTGAVEWEASAGTPVPSGELHCGDITPTVGIVSTPVIDTETKTIYVVADTWDGHEAHHILDGFALAHGEPVLSTPVDPPGVDATTLLQRSALTLDSGDVVFGFGGNDGSCSKELAPVVAVPTSGGPARFWQTHSSSGTTAGGLWATGGAALDKAGDIYASTANPIPTGEITEYDYSDSVVKLSLSDFVERPTEELLQQLGSFEPPDWQHISNNDLDLGSAGAEPLPGGLLFQAGKDGIGYLIDEATMESVYSHEVCGGLGSFGGDSYAEGAIYIPCLNGVQALFYDQAARTFTPLWQGPRDATGSPIVSACEVWTLATGASGPFSGGGDTLYGLDPATGTPLQTETLISPVADHFGSPSAAGGRLFVAAEYDENGEIVENSGSVIAYKLSEESAPGATCSSATAPREEGKGGAEEGKGGAEGKTDAEEGRAGATTATGTPPATNAPLAGGASAPSAGPPLLLHTHLSASAGGRVKLSLRCAVACRGTVSLLARLLVTRRGAHNVHETIFLALARIPYAHARGDFTISASLSASALSHLRLHHGRLALRVAISSAQGARAVSGVLTAAGG